MAKKKGECKEMYQTLLVERIEGVLKITLNKPETLNALDMVMREELHDLLLEASTDDEVKAVVITGAGRAFCSGGDIGTMGTFKPGEGRRRIQKVQRITRVIWNMEKPVIAAVNGACAGAGMNLAMSCDFILASDKSKFLEAFIKIGLIPDLGGFYLLPRRIGIANAKDLIMTGRTIDAQEALNMGVVNKIVPGEELMDEAMKMATKFAKGPTRALGLAKMLLNRSFETDLDASYADEAYAQDLCMVSDDFQEGLASFREKRPPHFQGK